VDYVLVDAPPIVPVTDAAVLAPRVDGVLLVLRAGKTKREMAQRAKELLLQVNARILGVVLTNLAESTEQAGDYDAAEQLLHEAIDAALEFGAQGNVVAFLESLAGVYAAQGRADPAIRLLAAADAYRADRGRPLDGAERSRVDAIIEKARTEAGPVRFALAWAGGSALSLTQAVNEVLRRRNQRGVADVQQIHASWLQADEAVDPAPW